jgi:diguanylate cyclase (GGDEF)-like protein
LAERVRELDPTAEYLFAYLGNVIYNPAQAELDINKLPKDFQEFGKGLLYFVSAYQEVSDFAKALSRGDLSVKPPPSSNEMAGSLKSLQAALKHLTWQTQQVVKGDYQQHVTFMGEFSDAFNLMVDQLSRKQSEWMKEASMLQDAANLDTLTKLYSRRFGLKTLNDWLADEKSFIICFADMDNLKYVNDKYLHTEGDVYIFAVATALRTFSKDAVISRMGGDEFMLLQIGWNVEQAENRFEEIIRDLAATADDRYYRSISYGVIAVGSQTHVSVSDLLATVDEKMYIYKRSHRKKRNPE